MKSTVSIVGAGRVGRALGKMLRARGWRVGAVVTRSGSTARAAVRAIGTGRAHRGLTAEVLDADVILLTTPDRVLASTAEGLAQLGRVGEKWLAGKVILHTSGALDSSVLTPLGRLGAATGSLHPMQTFSGRGAPKLRGVIFAVEGNARARKTGKEIARSLGGVPIEVASRDKPAYHAAGVLVAGHALGLVEGATQILIELGFPRRRAQQTLLPLMKQMLENFERVGPKAAWTGPVAREDYAVVSKHMAALKRYPPQFVESYAALAKLGLRALAKESGARMRHLDRALKNTRGEKN